MSARALLAATLASLSAPALAQDIATGNAEAQVIRALAISRIADLSFGTIVSPRAGGVVTVPADGGSAVYAGGVNRLCPGGTGCDPHVARFAVTGEAGRAYAVSLPARLRLPGEGLGGGPAATLTITGFTVRTASRAGAAGLLDRDGEDSFAVGGTLEVEALAPPARYVAQVPVIVTYS